MEEKELYKIIQQQKEEIESLKQIVEDLQTKIINPIPIKEEIDLKSYYLRQYLDKAKDIVDTSITIINQEIENINDIKEVLNSEEEMRKLQLIEKEALQKEIDVINEEIQQFYLNNEKKIFEYETKEEALKKRRNNLIIQMEKDWNKVYSYILEYKNSKMNLKELLEVIDLQKNKVLKENNQEIIDLIEIKNELNLLSQNKLIESNQNNNDLTTLKNKKEELNTKLQINHISPKTNRLDDILIQYDKKVTNKKNLENLLNEAIALHQKQIEDEYLRLSLIGTSNKEIAFFLDTLITSKLEELQTIETEDIKLERKQKRLSDLKEEYLKLEKIQNEKEQNEIAYNHLQGLYLNVQKNVKEIEDYITKTKEVIFQNKRYLSFDEAYQSYHKNNVKLKQELNQVLTELKCLQDRRRIIVHDPFSKETLSSIDEKIKVAQSNYHMLEQQIKDNDERFNNLTNQEDNQKLLGIILEKEKYEEKLPQFYEQMQELKSLIDDYHHKLLKLKDELKTYQDIKNEIEELTNELNN